MLSISSCLVKLILFPVVPSVMTTSSKIIPSRSRWLSLLWQAERNVIIINNTKADVLFTLLLSFLNLIFSGRSLLNIEWNNFCRKQRKHQRESTPSYHEQSCIHGLKKSPNKKILYNLSQLQYDFHRKFD